MNPPIVYAIQNPLRRNWKTKELEPSCDFTPAAEYGEVKFLLGSNISPFNPTVVVRELAAGLRSFTDRDFLLLVGNPILIGLATAIAADYCDGPMNLLQWSGSENRYLKVQVDPFTDD
jgi:hypothetical protein